MCVHVSVRVCGVFMCVCVGVSMLDQKLVGVWWQNAMKDRPQ